MSFQLMTPSADGIPPAASPPPSPGATLPPLPSATSARRKTSLATPASPPLSDMLFIRRKWLPARLGVFIAAALHVIPRPSPTEPPASTGSPPSSEPIPSLPPDIRPPTLRNTTSGGRRDRDFHPEGRGEA